MLMWERLTSSVPLDDNSSVRCAQVTTVTHRLPYDKRCAATTKAGRRCKGRIRQGTEFCHFHDPSVSSETRRLDAAKGGKRHHRLSHLPDGYLRKLTSRRGVGQAMDRLYRELRLGIVTPEMATVLFSILTRFLDSGLCDGGETSPRTRNRCKADRLRPKLSDLLTRTERQAWRKAVRNAPAAFLRNEHSSPKTAAQEPNRSPAKATGIALTAAS